MTDTELLDWLEWNLPFVSFSKSGEGWGPDAPPFTIFTIPSQHIKGNNIRELIESAIEQAKVNEIKNPFLASQMFNKPK